MYATVLLLWMESGSSQSPTFRLYKVVRPWVRALLDRLNKGATKLRQHATVRKNCFRRSATNGANARFSSDPASSDWITLLKLSMTRRNSSFFWPWSFSSEFLDCPSFVSSSITVKALILCSKVARVESIILIMWRLWLKRRSQSHVRWKCCCWWNIHLRTLAAVTILSLSSFLMTIWTCVEEQDHMLMATSSITVWATSPDLSLSSTIEYLQDSHSMSFVCSCCDSTLGWIGKIK